jgi:hypothetical protein
MVSFQVQSVMKKNSIQDSKVKSVDEYVEIMSNLNLSKPEMIG